MSDPVTNVIEPTLHIGSRGSKVKDLQDLLSPELGTRKHIIVDGLFGRRTERAVKIMQYRFFLKRDGVVGPKTWQVLRTHSLIEKPYLCRGNHRELIMRVQQVLKDSGLYKGAVDGDFEWQTEGAVKALQKERCLIVDGTIDHETWDALVELAHILTTN